MADYVGCRIFMARTGALYAEAPQGTVFAATSGFLSVKESWGTSAVNSNQDTTRSSASVFSSSGTWTNPLYAGATGNFTAHNNVGMVYVFVLGAGGGGACGINTQTQPSTIAAGGAGGGCSMMMFPAVVFPEQVPVIVGAGGTGAVFPTTSGTSGGTSSFGSLPPRVGNFPYASGSFQTIWAGGGQGGQQTTSTARFAGGMGLWVGAPSSTSGTTLDAGSYYYSGAAGGRGSAVNIAGQGGAAGVESTASSGISGGTAGTDGANGTNGGNGTDWLSSGVLRGGTGGGGGGAATTAGGTGGNGGNGGQGAGGGAGGGLFNIASGTRGAGGNGGTGYVVVVSW
jgi:hypothetical protein